MQSLKTNIKMEVTPKQQTVELIEGAKNILVVSHKNPDGDSLGCLVALKIALEKLNKQVALACADSPNRVFAFLPRIDGILSEIKFTRDLIISLSLQNAQLDKLGYRRNKKENAIDIIITPKDGKFSEDDVSVKSSGSKFDLIIVVDTPNLERLGSIAQPADIFYEIPTINIDHHPSNERFGKVNWVELIATSTAEILVSLLEALSKDVHLIDKDVATALLTGLIYDTSSFQNVNTTPKSLTVAAQLVAAGGRQQEIIKNLYKTKTLGTLKLWGIILSSVKEDKIHRFLWSAVTREDVEKANADEGALSGILDELLKSAAEVDFALLLSEREDQVHGSLRSVAKGFNVAEIAEIFGGGGHEAAAAFRLEGRLKDLEDDILQKIRSFQDKKDAEVTAAPVDFVPLAKEEAPADKADREEPAEEAAKEEKVEKIGEEDVPKSPFEIDQQEGEIEETADLPIKDEYAEQKEEGKPETKW
jgi:phosphoesterase RecJ-like protein